MTLTELQKKREEIYKKIIDAVRLHRPIASCEPFNTLLDDLDDVEEKMTRRGAWQVR